MGIKDFFRKDKETGPDPLSDLILAKLKVGYFVDYDLKTWEVTGYNVYDWGEGDKSYEWQLKSADDVVYLERESEDEEEWSLNRKVAFSRLGSDVKKKILEGGDPPEQIDFEGTTYYMEETSGGHLREGGGEGPGKEMLRWSYEDESGRSYLGVEQWGEEDFDASIGEPVEEYQFSNILPRELDP